ncbi:hypothetical protein HanRHA438_Chr05g0228641 [Helianthus annuus]|nr:hypothetical protein HanHA300_Chr05g0179701 [Helianthus annuus]KAJ0577456.1 hypothetical protein HanIR_Chr05g0236221 [Helianthus annuus]KAJ0584925.1 hypothetical protein HanHA89_Chr05g0194401 [Helianthus annuus]KAJ0919349.1 hypothetical protein HanRHA438_Chr05g0228641 [Helianthus annuus]
MVVLCLRLFGSMFAQDPTGYTNFGFTFPSKVLIRRFNSLISYRKKKNLELRGHVHIYFECYRHEYMSGEHTQPAAER